MHRTWFKVLLNPILRKFGRSIVSVVDEKTQKVLAYELRKYPKHCKRINDDERTPQKIRTIS